MAVKPRRDVRADENRNTQLQAQVLEGYNVWTPKGKLPLVGKWLKEQTVKVTDKMPTIGADFTTKGFQNFYTEHLEVGMENYGRFVVTERKYVTPSAIIQGESACRKAYDHDDPLKFGSYIGFCAEDESLEGKLSVGHQGDKELIELLSKEKDMDTETKIKKSVEWAKHKLKREGVQGAGDVVAATVLRVVYAPLALIGIGDLGRRVYNTAKIDSHWTLTLNPKGMVTARQFDAYRALVEKFRT